MSHVQDVIVCLFLTISLFSMGTIQARFRGNETDRQALLAFKRSISKDPQGVLSSWNDSLHFCQWEGVTCNGRHRQRVTILEFLSRGLAGTLSPYVGNLSFLSILQINNNSLYGEIPSQISHLSRLKVLNLNFNNLGGKIPASISHCTKLIQLAVANNMLVGEIPEELSALSKLVSLLIFTNNLTGAIPLSLGNLTSLEAISASENLFVGSIPDSIGRLKSLNFFALADNNLSGMIPPSLYNLSSLGYLSLAYNQLQGSLQPNIGFMLPNLLSLHLNDNQFTGSLPASLSNCSSLQILEMSTNNLSGKISIDFGGLKIIQSIFLGQNYFGSGELDEMNFIGSVANWTNFLFMYLENNQLRGSLPNFVANKSTHFFYLNLGKNLLYGSLPSTIGNLVGLTTLDLSDNQFTERIPTTIGNLQKIEKLFLQRNKFSGSIPDSIGKLPMLLELHMEMNRFEGSIPSSLGDCQRLLQLELSENNLSGPIPKQLFSLSALSIVLNLSRNHLVGSLPLEVGNLKSLGSLDVSENNLSGEIPSSFGTCTSLENLFLQENTFQGSIPSSFISLKGIINLNLSHNNLSGKIPRFFEQFSMKYLNLSFNNFEGEVPMRGIFANQSAISVLGNDKLCGGIPELHLRKCLVKEPKNRQERSHTIIIVVSIICPVLCVAMVLCFFFCWNKKTKKEKSSQSMAKESFLRVSYDHLFKATDGFSLENLIGRGSFGSVYKGILDEVVVAVKVLNLESRGASKSFMAECEALRNVRHRNLVKIITSCSSIDFHGNDFKALVYDFMPNGSLERWLYPTQEAQNELHRLSLLQRINIAIDVACALDYLHHQCEHPIIHCDLKPSNILLDRDMVAHVGDFGLAKFLLPKPTDATQFSSIGLRGTIGYAAPEYGIGSEISTSGDVYSFGIMLLEMMTGKRPTDTMFSEGLNLHNFASMALADHVRDIVDPLILKEDEEATEAVKINCGSPIRANITEECLVSTIKIGVACSVESPQARMNITNVVHELNLVRNSILQH